MVLNGISEDYPLEDSLEHLFTDDKNDSFKQLLSLCYINFTN